MLAAKMDLLVKRVEHYEKASTQEIRKAMDSHVTVKSVEMLDIQAIFTMKPKRTSTTSIGSIHNIKARISAPTTREVTIITLLLV